MQTPPRRPAPTSPPPGPGRVYGSRYIPPPTPQIIETPPRPVRIQVQQTQQLPTNHSRAARKRKGRKSRKINRINRRE